MVKIKKDASETLLLNQMKSTINHIGKVAVNVYEGDSNGKLNTKHFLAIIILMKNCQPILQKR